MTRAILLALVAAVAFSVSCKHPRPLRPRLDPITRTERDCEDKEEEDLEACVELGLMYEDGARFDPPDDDDDDDDDDAYRRRKRRRPPPPPRVLAVDLDQARALFQRACTGGEGLGCFHLARLAPDATAAAALHARGCELDDGSSCTARALDLEHGTGVAADPEAGHALMRKTCTDGHARACVNAGVVAYNESLDTAHRRDAENLLDSACAQGDPLGCHYLAQLQLPSAKTRWDLLRIRDTEEGACDRKVGAACAAAGAMYRDGVTAREQPARGSSYDHDYGSEDMEDEEVRKAVADAEYAVELFQKGCTLGDPDACQGLFLALVDGEGIAQNVGKAARMADEQCTAGHRPSCQSLGYFYELGLGVKQDAARAEALYRQECDVGDAIAAGSCSNLAEVLADRRQLEDAVVFAGRGCELGDARGCNAAGIFIVTGAWPGDHAVGLAMIRRACELARSAVDVDEFCAAAGRYH